MPTFVAASNDAIADADARARFRARVGPRNDLDLVAQRDEFGVARQRVGIGLDAGRVSARERHRGGEAQAEFGFETRARRRDVAHAEVTFVDAELDRGDVARRDPLRVACNSRIASIDECVM